ELLGRERGGGAGLHRALQADLEIEQGVERSLGGHLRRPVVDAGPLDAVDVPDRSLRRPLRPDDVEAVGEVVAPEALVPLAVTAAVAPVDGHDHGVGPVAADLLDVELRRPGLAGRLAPEGAVEPGAGRRPRADLPVAVALG